MKDCRFSLQGEAKPNTRDSEGRERPEELIALQSLAETSEAVLAAEQEQRNTRIRQLREQVRNGSYRADLRKVAVVLLHDDPEALVGP